MLGDEDGVVVVPASEVALTVAAARAREAAEAKMRDALAAGALTLDLLGLRGRLPVEER